MTKAQLIKALDGFPDETEILMEADAGLVEISNVDSEEYKKEVIVLS